jgi:hypothetical protein
MQKCRNAGINKNEELIPLCAFVVKNKNEQWIRPITPI